MWAGRRPDRLSCAWVRVGGRPEVISCPYTTQDRQRKVAVLATGYTLMASPTFTFR